MTSAEFLIDSIEDIISQDLLKHKDKWGVYHCPVSKGYEIIKSTLEEVDEVVKVIESFTISSTSSRSGTLSSGIITVLTPAL